MGNAKENLQITKAMLEEIEQHVSLENHFKRYAFVRQYAIGRVLDIACGCGYGSYLMSGNPECTEVVGVDRDEHSLWLANRDFKTDKTKFIQSDINEFTDPKGFDLAVSIETIEHLNKMDELFVCYIRNSVKKLIISFPAKKTTHFNPYHKHDPTLEDIKKLADPYYTVTDVYTYHREYVFVFLEMVPKHFIKQTYL